MKRLLLLVTLMVLVALVGMVGFSRDAESQNDTPTTSAISNAVSALQATAKATDGAVGTLQATVNEGVPAKAKMYYLTSGQFSGDQATAACSTGFHMARIFEILDTSHLQYATGLPGAYANDIILYPGDGPSGPSTKDFGWVRTAYDTSSDTDTVSTELSSGNCISWPSHTSNPWGTVARLQDNDIAAQLNSEYSVLSSQPCSQLYPVWCVENM